MRSILWSCRRSCYELLRCHHVRRSVPSSSNVLRATANAAPFSVMTLPTGTIPLCQTAAAPPGCSWPIARIHSTIQSLQHASSATVEVSERAHSVTRRVGEREHGGEDKTLPSVQRRGASLSHPPHTSGYEYLISSAASARGGINRKQCLVALEDTLMTMDTMSAKDLSMLTRAIGKLQKRGWLTPRDKPLTRFLELLDEVVTRQLTTGTTTRKWGAIDFSTLLYGLSLQALPLQPSSDLISLILERSRAILPAFDAFSISNLFYSLARLDCYSPNDALRPFVEHALSTFPYMQPKGICTLLWGVVRLNCQLPPGFTEAAIQAAEPQLHKFNHDDFSMLLWSLTRCKCDASPEFVAALTTAVKPLLYNFEPVNYSNLLLSLVKLERAVAGDVMAAVLAAAQWKLYRFKPREHSILIWSIAKIGCHVPRAFILDVLKVLPIASLAGPDCTMVLWGMAKLQLGALVPDDLIQRVDQRVEMFCSVDRESLTWALEHLDRDDAREVLPKLKARWLTGSGKLP